MPIMHVTTKEAKQVWQSPDGQRTIYKLVLDYNGQPVSASTYSQAIATVGWSGEVETYEKSSARGVETYVKQPPKEGGYSGGSSSRTSIQGSRSYPQQGKPQGDQFTMYLSYAKDLAVALISTKAYTPERLAEIVNDVALAGEQLYDAHNNPATSQDTVHEVTGAPVDLSLIDKVFSGEPEQEEETPWPSPSK